MKSLKTTTFTDSLQVVEVESTFMRGLPGFDIVGLASTTIKESESRVKAALQSLGFKFPASKIIINLSPSDVPKGGSHFDLAIALLIALQKQKISSEFFVFGELGLDGNLKSTAKLFSMLLFLSAKVKSAKVLLPKEVALKACMIPNYEVFAVENLAEAVRFFIDEEFTQSSRITATHPLFENTIKIEGLSYVPNFNFTLDFKDIKGQKRAKRASLIAACGMHNILFEGSPGCGKSMCAKRIHQILPPQSAQEVMLASAYESLNNKDVDFSPLRAYRAPHHTSTRSSIFGGGSSKAKIGEVALANGGELFFDELPHFSKNILESLREPLEDNKILVSRVNTKTEYETKFIFIAAQNPCPCGNLFSRNMTCSCTPIEIKRYKNAISVPILDRIDLYVAMEDINENDKSDISSKDMYGEVLRVFTIQKKRKQNELNGKMSDEEVEKFCILTPSAQEILNSAVIRYNLSWRGINKTLKVARTIADLDSSKLVEKNHILESLSFRMRDEI